MAALLVGAEDADARPVDRLSVGVGETDMLIAAARMTAAETGMVRQAAMTAQVGPSPYPGGSLNGLFNSGGLLGGFAAGFLGSGLLGLLFGRGLFGELGSVPSYLGLGLQLALLAMLCRLIWTRWRGADALGAAALSPRQLADPYLRSRDDLHTGLDPSADADNAAEADITPGTRRSPITNRRSERE